MISIGDYIKEFGKITRISDHFVWFGETKRALSTVNNAINGIIYKESPDTDIDWKNPKEVDDYYKTFKYWKGVVRMGHTKTRQVLEVKDNKVLFEGEYYLPFYHTYKSQLNCNEKNDKVFLEDGYIFGWCMKLHNSFYDHQNKNTVNVFFCEQKISEEQFEYGINKEQWKKDLSTIEYLKKIDLNKINSADLNLLKHNFTELFDYSIFPYTVNKVSFSFKKSEYKWEEGIYVYHRNRTGQLKIDNGYWGPTPFANDYYAILRCEPNFTNEHGTYVSVDIKNLPFDKSILDSLSGLIVKAWDRAIEQNFRIYG